MTVTVDCPYSGRRTPYSAWGSGLLLGSPPSLITTKWRGRRISSWTSPGEIYRSCAVSKSWCLMNRWPSAGVVSLPGLFSSTLSSVPRRLQPTSQRQPRSFLSHWMIEQEECSSILSLGERVNLFYSGSSLLLNNSHWLLLFLLALVNSKIKDDIRRRRQVRNPLLSKRLFSCLVVTLFVFLSSLQAPPVHAPPAADGRLFWRRRRQPKAAAGCNSRWHHVDLPPGPVRPSPA